MDQRVARILRNLQLSPDQLPCDFQKWQQFLVGVSTLLNESSQRLEIAENSLAVSSEEMERLYNDLKVRLQKEQAEATDRYTRLTTLIEATLDMAADGILVVDHESGEVMKCNEQFYRLWRIPFELQKTKDDKRLLDFVVAQLKDPDVFVSKVLYLYKNPNETSADILEFTDGRTFERLSVPLLLEGKVVSRVWYFRDITEKLAKDRELDQRKSELMHSSKLASLGEMAAGIAHEINNPLAMIAGNLPLLTKFKDNPEKFGSKIETMFKATARIDKIVKGLKRFSRSSDGSVCVLEDLSYIVGEALIITDAKARQYSVKIETSLAEGVEILCDGVEIEQVLVNLINNGIDAVRDKSDKWVRVETSREAELVFIRVTDSGLGISQEIEQKLFQPFFTTKVVGEGTGLGLSITRGILERHGATISLNRAMKNTCFEIRFAQPKGVRDAA